MSKQTVDKGKPGEGTVSAVDVFLHALVVIEISDHFTRGKLKF
jgi:hypothetical protein